MKLAILLYGRESDKPVLNEIISKIQLLLNDLNKDDVEMVYNVNDESSVEELKMWLMEQTLAKKYVFINSKTEIPDNFLLLRYNAIKYGQPTKKLVELGIFSK